MSFSCLWVPAAPAQLVLYPSSWAGLLAAGVGWGPIPWESVGLMVTVRLGLGSLPAELRHPPQSGAQGVTTTLGKVTLCHHFRQRQGPHGTAEQRMMMVGRVLGPSFGRQRRWEKAGLRLCQDWAPFGGSPCSGCSSPPQAPLLFQPTASQGVWPCVPAQLISPGCHIPAQGS